jgi:uncharacterized RDD family membrane protein YckC
MESEKTLFPINRLAHPGKRFQAQFIDELIACAIGIAVCYSLDNFFSRDFSVYSGIAIALVYFLFSDGFANGQSFGKNLLKIQVLDDGGINPCSWTQSFFRNVTFLLGIIDWIFILFKSHRRLGDYIAGTIVVKFTPSRE